MTIGLAVFTVLVVCAIAFAGLIEVDARRCAREDDAFDEHADQALALGNEHPLLDVIASRLSADLDDELADLLGGAS